MIPIYVNDIKCSLENKCYFAALSLALTLPDICGMAEFPSKSVAERYIEWYDKYLGVYMNQGNDYSERPDPWLSGEIIYNLRNTYLHQGNPGIVSDKVKEEVNQLDVFTLMLGDGTVFHEATLNIEVGTQETGKITYRRMLVDVTYLCNSICDCALWYYEKNQEKFKFHFNVITQEEYLHPSEDTSQIAQGDSLVKIINFKLEKNGSTMRLAEDPNGNRDRSARLKEGLDIIWSDEAMKMRQRFPKGDSIFTYSEQGYCRLAEKTDTKNESKKKQTSKNVSKEKREAQVRSFFGRHFKKKKYIDKKEEIIQAVLRSETKLQLNNSLMRHFTNKEVRTIYQRFEPLIKDLPEK